MPLGGDVGLMELFLGDCGYEDLTNVEEDIARLQKVVEDKKKAVKMKEKAK